MALSKREKALSSLQSIDTEMDRLKKDLETMPEKQELVEMESSVAEIRKDLSAAEKTVGDVEHEQKKREDESSRLESKIATEEKKLYAGTINNPKELMSLQQEIKILSDEKDTVDTAYLIGLDELSDARAEEDKLRKSLDQGEARAKELSDAIAKQNGEIKASLEAAEEERKKPVQEIDELTLKTYEQMRIKGHGIAVATAVDGICGGCNLENSEDSGHGPSDGPVRRCEYCHRILIST